MTWTDGFGQEWESAPSSPFDDPECLEAYIEWLRYYVDTERFDRRFPGRAAGDGVWDVASDADRAASYRHARSIYPERAYLDTWKRAKNHASRLRPEQQVEELRVLEQRWKGETNERSR